MSADSAGQAAVKIIVADGQVMFRQGLRQLLESETWLDVIGDVGTAAEIFSLARGLEPALVVLELDLPDRDGIAVIRDLQQELPDIAAVVLTSCTARRRLMDSFKAGAAAYLLKSCLVEDLVSVLRRVSRGVRGIIRPETFKGTESSEYGAVLPRDGGRLNQLTPRELQVLKLLAQGKSTKEAAHYLGVSPKTVETHRLHLFEKLDCQTVVALTHIAIGEGLVLADSTEF